MGTSSETVQVGWGTQSEGIFLPELHLQVYALILSRSVAISRAYLAVKPCWYTFIRLGVIMGIQGFVYLSPSVNMLAYYSPSLSDNNNTFICIMFSSNRHKNLFIIYIMQLKNRDILTNKGVEKKNMDKT